MTPPAELGSQDPVPLREATRTWLGIAAQTFGGPAAQIAVMHRVLVDEKRWIGERRFLHALNFCTLLPGPEAQQLAIYCGWLMNGTVGGLVAGTLFVAPGFATLLAVSLTYATWGETAVVTALFAGVAPAVLPMVIQAVRRIAGRALATSHHLAIAVAAFAALWAFDIPFPLVIAAAALIGLALGRLVSDFDAPPTRSDEDPAAPPPLIADDALHDAPRSTARSLRVLALGLAMWGTPLVLIAAWLGADSTLFEIGAFFSVTSLVTFGGAYAVLSFIGQRAVSVYGWLLPGEMATALALAETTPGPLIQLVQFVGFIGAYRSPDGLDPLVAGLLATAVVCWVTYVPCFLWIFLGAPYLEGLRANQRLSHALSAVTAAVVGVIANLAVFFALHTLFGEVHDREAFGPLRISTPVWSSAEWQPLVIASAAGLALTRFRQSIPHIVLAAAVGGGLLIHLTG